MTTSIPLDADVRDRLRTFGFAGDTYSDILTRLMDEVERQAFVDEMRRLVANTPEDQLVDLEDVE